METTILVISILVVGTLLSSELLIWLPLRTTLSALFLVTAKIHRTLQSDNISDHWKEIMLLVYAKHLLKYSLLITVLLLFSALPLIMLAWMIYGELQNTIEEISKTNNFLVILATSTIYLVVRTR